MRQISDCLPAWLIDEMAARGHDGAHNLSDEGGGSSAGRDSDETPTLCVDAPTPSGSSEVDGKPGEAARPVGSTKPNVLSGQFQPSPARGRPVLVVIQGNRGEPTHAAHEGVFPARRVGSPLVLVWDRDHSNLANSP
jgi:hypothetical protein